MESDGDDGMTSTIDLLTWRVTRFCCTSGMCIECRAVANGTKRKRIAHADRLTQDRAETIARNWSSYGATAEPMPTETDQV